MSYNQSINNSFKSTDNWSSIGIKYKKQSQQMKALHTYISAVKSDTCHTTAWVDLGILYERCHQPHDALTCYYNAMQNSNESINPSLQARIKLLETQLDKIQTFSYNKTLPSVTEAWSLPISPKQSNVSSKVSTSITSDSIELKNSSTAIKRIKGDIVQEKNKSPRLYKGDCIISSSSVNKSLNINKTEADRELTSDRLRKTQQKKFLGVRKTANESLESNELKTSKPNNTLVQNTKNHYLFKTDNCLSPPILYNINDDFQQDLSLVNDLSPPVLTPITPSINIHMCAQSIIDCCKGLGYSGDFTDSIISDDCLPISPPNNCDRLLSIDELHPTTPSIFIETIEDAFSQEFQRFCLSNDICIVRGIASALKLDLGLFSTKSLVETNADHPVEIRTQRQFSPDENCDSSGNQIWRCESSRSLTTIVKYAQYQASTYQESIKDGQDYPIKDKSQIKKKKFKSIRFGTNVDLSCKTKWPIQLHELTKLPPFMRVISSVDNMLSYINYTVLGMNSVQLYMKVPGSRTPGHQENNNFCSINVNIGPGDCEWFATPEPYWGNINQLCEKHNINFLTGSWWPILEELIEAKIPVYRFIQKPGDLVWVGSGAVHWVQAIGWCNNVAWNVGPITAKQYSLAIERYEYNKLQAYKSIVPMLYLSWNLAKKLKIMDTELYEQIKFVLMRSIRFTTLAMDYFKSIDKDLNYQSVDENEPAHYCNTCEVEVFNILLVTEHEKKQCHVVYCLECAKRSSKNLTNFVALNQYQLKDLIKLYDDFKLCKEHDSNYDK